MNSTAPAPSAEIRRWRDDRTLPAMARGTYLPLNISSPNNEDRFWLQESSTRKE